MLTDDDADFRNMAIARLERMLEELKSMDLFLWDGLFPCLRVTVRRRDDTGDALTFVVGVEMAERGEVM